MQNRTPAEQRLTTPILIDDTQFEILTDYGLSKGTEMQSHSTHTHSAHEVHLIEAGELTIETGKDMITLSTGEILVIKANIPHRVVSHSHDLARFTFRFLTDSSAAFDRMLKNGLHFMPKQTDTDELLNAARHLRRLHSMDPNKYESIRFKSYYSIIFSFMLGASCTNDKHSEHKRYSRLSLYTEIEDYFRLNCDKQITLESLANHLCYSKAQTNRILLDYNGGSFSQILRDMRIETAKTLLAKTDTPIGDIAQKCGYHTRQGFELMFGKCAGMTPRAYREQNAKKPQQ